MKLPSEVSPVLDYEKVTKLLIGGLHGTSKTHLTSTLPNSLLVDLEEGHRSYFGGMVLNVKGQARLEGLSLSQAFRETINLIQEANKESFSKTGKKAYDFITFDNITQLQEIAKVKAALDYNSSHVGKGQIKGGSDPVVDVTTEVGQLGWMYFMNAYRLIFDMCCGLAEECTIFLAHTTQSSLAKKQEQIVINDLQITGKAKAYTLLTVDDAAVLSIENNKATLDFTANAKSPTKTRSKHLRNKEIVISELQDDGTLITHWEEVFPYYNFKK